MMLFKLSLRNIRRNLKNYGIYFATLALGTALFYVFNSLESQTVMLNVSQNTHLLVETINEVMGVLSVGVAVILGGLILYASRFLMKQRKREFGIYMTLGMGKGQIARILFFETLVIGALSLAVGLALGILASQFMSVLVASMFEADMSQFQFVFSAKAALITLAMFAAIYLVVMIFNTIAVNRTKLINLIRSPQTNEKVRFRGTLFCSILFLISIALLAFTYYSATVTFKDANFSEEELLIIIAMGVVGTFALFWSWSGLALKLAQKFKSFYFRGLHTFVLREVNSKINTTVIAMSIICLLLFATIGIFSTAMSLNQAINSDLRQYAPADFSVVKMMPYVSDISGEYNLGASDQQTTIAIGEQQTATDGKVVEQTPEQIEHINRLFAQTDLTAEEVLRDELALDLDALFREYVAAKTYHSPELTYNETIGRTALLSQGSFSAEYLGSFLGQHENIIKQSDYNRLATLYGQPTVELSDDQYAVVANMKRLVNERNYALANIAPTIEVAGQQLEPSTHEVISGFIYLSDGPSNQGLIVVPDHLDLGQMTMDSFFVGNYRTEDELVKIALDEELTTKVLTASPEYIFMRPDSKIRIYESSVGTSVMATFVGLYLGSVFLITSAAILALKEVSESSDNHEKYLVLAKLGVDRRQLSRALLAQIALFFGLPLLVACVHSVFGIMFASNLVNTFSDHNLFYSIAMTALFILAIYGGYFAITYWMARRIVLSRD